MKTRTELDAIRSLYIAGQASAEEWGAALDADRVAVVAVVRGELAKGPRTLGQLTFAVDCAGIGWRWSPENTHPAVSAVAELRDAGELRLAGYRAGHEVFAA